MITQSNRAANASCLIAGFVVLALCATDAHAGSGELKPSDFDTDRDGSISVTEFEVYQLHKRIPLLRAMDTNKDGVVDGEDEGANPRRTLGDYVAEQVRRLRKEPQTKEEDTAFGDAHRAFSSQIMDLEKEIERRAALDGDGDDETLLNQVANDQFGPSPFRKPFMGTTLFLRRDVAELNKAFAVAVPSASDATRAKVLRDSKGALVGYTRDYNEDSDTYQVQSAVGWKPGWEFPGSISPVFTLSVDRLTNDEDKTKEVDSVIGRVGFDWSAGDGFLFDGNEFKFRGSYATDHRFDSAVFAGEIDWEPALFPLAIGTSRYVRMGDQFTLFEYRWTPRMHAEFGRVEDAGRKENLTEDDGFFRWGPEISLEVWSKFVDGLSASAAYGHLETENAGSKDSDSDLFKATLDFALSDNLTLSMSYTNGDAPLTKEDTDALVIGLSLRF